MNFFLTEEQEAIRAAIRELVEREIAPRAAHYDRTGDFPWDNVAALARANWLNFHLPEAYGGAGADYLSYAIALEEIARGCATTAAIVDVHCTLHSEAILNFGTEAQKRKHLPRLSRGEILGAYALTEPTAGSNPAQMKCRAERKGDRYVLNGEKAFITCGDVCDQYVLFASTDPARAGKGITAFIVDARAKGVRAGRPEEKMGIRASHTTSVSLTDVEVPVEDRLGEEGQGLMIALHTLDSGRIGIAAQAVGIAQAGLDLALPYARRREQFGQPIAEFQAIQHKLANMAMEIEAARLLVYRAAFLRERGRRVTCEAAMAKLFASEVAMRQTTEAVQVLGGYGYMTDYGVERLMRDAKITQIYEGTSEIQRLVISRHLLGGG